MKELKTKLKIHTPWYIYSSSERESNTKNDFWNEQHHFDCGEICNIDIYNNGTLIFNFKNNVEEPTAKEYSAIVLYFISVCNGYNCEYENNVYIDGIEIQNFFNYVKEDSTSLPLIKNVKFYEISLGDIQNCFGNIVDNLFSANRMFMLSLLANYYSMVVYKDFVGNGIYKFRNIVTNLESLISLIYKDKYLAVKNKNQEYIKTIADNSSLSNTQLKKHIMPKTVSLQEKVKDMFSLLSKYGLKFKLDCEVESNKIANTRNFISHLFDNSQINYLTNKEILEYTAVFEEIFRMLFLEYCGVSVTMIKEKFLQNKVIKLILNSVFDIG